MMKLIEIGDGLKSMKVPSNYFVDSEEDNTTIVYDPNIDFVEIRISVISVKPKDGSDLYAMYRRVLERAKEKGIPHKIVEDKCYYEYQEESKSENKELTVFYYEIGYLNNLILISATTETEYCQNNKEEEDVENALITIINSIPTISEINIENQTIFEPTYSDLMFVNNRISEILNINEDAIDEYHKSEKTLPMIQKYIDVFTAENTYELQSLGLVLGDYIQYAYDDFHWSVVRDEYGRDICLQYKSLSLIVFPMTMISKRIEDGEELNVAELVANLIEKVTEIAKEEFE